MRKFGQKIQNCLFKVKFGILINSNMLNSMVIITFLFWIENTRFCTNLVQKIETVCLWFSPIYFFSYDFRVTWLHHLGHVAEIFFFENVDTNKIMSSNITNFFDINNCFDSTSLKIYGHFFSSQDLLTLWYYRNYLNECRGAHLIFYLSEEALTKKMQNRY